MAKIETLVDTFSGTLALWSVGTSGATIVSGAMSIPYSGGTAKVVTSASHWDASGSRIFAKMSNVSLTNPTDQSELRLVDSSNSARNVGFTVYDGTLWVFVGDPGGSSNQDAVAAYDATAHAWWQIAESGGTFTMYVSPDGTDDSWNAIWAYPHTWAATSVDVKFTTVGTSGSLAVDNVNSVATSGGVGGASATIKDRPDATHGIQIGKGSWRYGVELLTTTGSVYGTAVYGTDPYGGFQLWVDLTSVATGLVFTRGTNTLADRPNPGTGTLTADNSNDLYSPWRIHDEPYFGPGAVIRAWLNNPSDANAATGWLPLFCGEIETVDDPPTDADAYRFVSANLTEPHSDLAKVDGLEQSPVGAGEQVVDRVVRLLDSADYTFGQTVADIVLPVENTDLYSAQLQATNLAQNRLTEIYLTVDSVDYQFVSSKSGRPQLIPMPTYPNPTRSAFHDDDGYEYAALGELTDDSLDTDDLSFTLAPAQPVALMPWVDLTPTGDNEAIKNEVALARVGGTVQTRTTSPARTGFARFARSDLILQDDGNVGILAQRLLDRLSTAGLYCQVTLDASMSPKLVDYLAWVDLYSTVELLRVFTRHGSANPVRLSCIVLGYSMSITPRAENRLTWTATLDLQVFDVNDYP